MCGGRHGDVGVGEVHELAPRRVVTHDDERTVAEAERGPARQHRVTVEHLRQRRQAQFGHRQRLDAGDRPFVERLDIGEHWFERDLGNNSAMHRRPEGEGVVGAGQKPKPSRGVAVTRRKLPAGRPNARDCLAARRRGFPGSGVGSSATRGRAALGNAVFVSSNGLELRIASDGAQLPSLSLQRQAINITTRRRRRRPGTRP